jgi:hypothetical protein
VAEEADKALHAAFFIPARHRTGLGGEVIVSGELEQARMKADVIADPLEDDTLSCRRDRPGYARRAANARASDPARSARTGARPGEHEHEAERRRTVAPTRIFLKLSQSTWARSSEGVEAEIGLAAGGRTADIALHLITEPAAAPRTTAHSRARRRGYRPRVA